MSTSHRQERVAEMLMHELSVMVTLELSDPRLLSTTVTAVKVSPDLRAARVYVSHSGEPAEGKQVLDALKHASGYLRRQLAQRVILRLIPELTFEIDRTLMRAQRIDELLDSLAHEPVTPDQSPHDHSTAESEPGPDRESRQETRQPDENDPSC